MSAWTKEKPRVEGSYLWKEPGYMTCRIKVVDLCGDGELYAIGDGGTFYLQLMPGAFSGPIPQD